MQVLRSRLELPVGMGLALAGGAGLIGGIAGDIFSSNSAQQTNAMNMQISQMNNQFNAQQAALNRSFQENMADTQIQRRMADLRAAGVNPLLGMASGQGAAAPSGATASSAGLPQVQSPGAAFSNLGQIASNAVSSGAQAEQAFAQAKNLNMSSLLMSAKLPYAGQQAQQEMENLRSQGQDIKASAFLKGAQFDNTLEDTTRLMQNNEYQLEMWSKMQQMYDYELKAKQYGLPSLAADADFMNSKWGRMVPLLQKLVVPGSVAVANGAGALKDVLGSILQFMPQYVMKSMAGPGGVFRGGSVISKGIGSAPVNP